MALIKKEIKHIVKMRSTVITFILLFFITIGIVIISGYIRDAYVLTESGEIKTISGIAAIKEIQRVEEEGPLTTEWLMDVFKRQRLIYDQYGLYPSDEIFTNQVFPDNNILNILSSVYRNEDGSYDSAWLGKINEEDILNFYEKRAELVQAYYARSYGEESYTYQKAMEDNSKVETPFIYYTFIGWNNIVENLGTFIGIIAFLFSIILVSQFSGNYQNGADTIYRTTNKGRKDLAIVRLASIVIIGCLCYLILLSIYLLLSIIIFGGNALNIPVQLYDIYAVKPYVLYQVIIKTAAMGIGSILAILSIAMFIAACTKSKVYAIVITLLIIIFPSIVQSVSGLPRIIYAVADCFPSSGLGIYGELLRSNYYNFGNLMIWSPNVIVFASIINIFVWVPLAIKKYINYQESR